MFNKINKKSNNLEKKILKVTTLIHINQYNTDKQSLEKNIGDVDKKKYQTCVSNNYSFEYQNQ